MIYQKVTLARNLQRQLKRKGISQSQLIKRVGMSHTTLHGYLYGVTPQGLDNLIKLANYFELGLDDLVFNSGEVYHA